MLQKLFERFRRPTPRGADDVDRLRELLARPVTDNDLDRLFPVLLPRDCLDGWPGPTRPIGALPFAVSWALFHEPHHFIYVNDEVAARWSDRGIDWRARAMMNLARRTATRPWWGEIVDDTERPFLLALLHDDAMGPSRLFLPHHFDDVLGAEYRVAVPERTCAIAYRAELEPDQQRKVDAVIENCFRHGSEPVSPERFEPREFWILDRPEGSAQNSGDRGAEG